MRHASLRTALPLAAAACLAFPAGAAADARFVSPPPAPNPPVGGAWHGIGMLSPEGYPVLHPGEIAVQSERKVFAAAVHLPVVTSFSPRRVKVGQVLTIRGRYFRPGKGRNTVVFQRAGGRYVFVKAGRASSTKILVRIPPTMTSFLARSHGAASATRFRIRILAARFGAKFTPTGRSPVVVPPASGSTANTCSPTGAGLGSGGDADKDGLPNGLELKVHTNPCSADTDGDGLSDFWEYKSALDYNSRALPYPGKRPYPNPLDPTDKTIDFDGDGMTAAEEYAAWAKCGNKDINKPLFMSDGEQSSIQVVATPSTQLGAHLDLNMNGILTDDERDSDLCDPTGIKGDHLSNYVEQHGAMVPAWWTAVMSGDHPGLEEHNAYGPSRFQQTDWLDPDTDGDGLLDGPDDTDHDGWSNENEIFRHARWPGEGSYWVQPFNPCLPDPNSRTCSLHIPLDPESAWAPFDPKSKPPAGSTIPFQTDQVGAWDPEPHP